MSNTNRPETPVESPVRPPAPKAAPLLAFVEAPEFRRWALWGLAGLCIVLFIMELILPAKLHSDAVRIPGKYAAIGFASVGIAVLAGWVTGFLRQEPDYYGEARDRLPEADEPVAEWRAEERGR